MGDSNSGNLVPVIKYNLINPSFAKNFEIWSSVIWRVVCFGSVTPLPLVGAFSSDSCYYMMDPKVITRPRVSCLLRYAGGTFTRPREVKIYR